MSQYAQKCRLRQYRNRHQLMVYINWSANTYSAARVRGGSWWTKYRPSRDHLLMNNIPDSTAPQDNTTTSASPSFPPSLPVATPAHQDNILQCPVCHQNKRFNAHVRVQVGLSDGTKKTVDSCTTLGTTVMNVVLDASMRPHASVYTDRDHNWFDASHVLLDDTHPFSCKSAAGVCDYVGPAAVFMATRA